MAHTHRPLLAKVTYAAGPCPEGHRPGHRFFLHIATAAAPEGLPALENVGRRRPCPLLLVAIDAHIYRIAAGFRGPIACRAAAGLHPAHLRGREAARLIATCKHPSMVVVTVAGGKSLTNNPGIVAGGVE
jgi:hypothetical protein